MTSKKKNTKQKGRNLPEAIADKLRTMISKGELAPGVQLRQMGLADEFGTSRVPLREALKLLTVEGVIEHDQNRGFFVSKFSYDEACQLYRIRHLLEGELLKSIEWPNKSQLLSLEKKVEKLKTFLQNKDGSSWLEVHRSFFEGIFQLSPHKILVKEALRFIRLTDGYRSLAPYTLAAHKRIPTHENNLLKALKKQDREELIATYEKDRSEIEAALLDSLQLRGL